MGRMTQTEQVDIQQRMREACERFYEAFDFAPERILVYYGQKPHLPPLLGFSVTNHIGVVAIEAPVPSRLNWGEFMLYSPSIGRVMPEDLQPGPVLIKKMIEARGYAVLMAPMLLIDRFYIFNHECFIRWPFLKTEYADHSLTSLKDEINMVLKNFKENNDARID